MSTNLDIYLETVSKKDLAKALSTQLAVDKKTGKIVLCCRQNCSNCLMGTYDECSRPMERYLLKESEK